MTTLLCIETSGSHAPGEIALCVGGPENILAERALPQEQSQAQSLAPAIAEMLAQTGHKPSDLNALAVSLGPGSFTGVRIGLATAQGFSLAHQTPIVGVSSLAALALHGQTWANARGSEAIVCSMVDARKGELYACCYRFENTQPVALAQETHARPDDFIELLLRHDTKQPLLILGDAVTTYEAIFSNLRNQANWEIWKDAKTAAIPARNVARLAWPRLQQSPLASPRLIKPVYLRPEEKEFKQNP